MRTTPSGPGPGSLTNTAPRWVRCQRGEGWKLVFDDCVRESASLLIITQAEALFPLGGFSRFPVQWMHHVRHPYGIIIKRECLFHSIVCFYLNPIVSVHTDGVSALWPLCWVPFPARSLLQDTHSKVWTRLCIPLSLLWPLFCGD